MFVASKTTGWAGHALGETAQLNINSDGDAQIQIIKVIHDRLTESRSTGLNCITSIFVSVYFKYELLCTKLFVEVPEKHVNRVFLQKCCKIVND